MKRIFCVLFILLSLLITGCNIDQNENPNDQEDAKVLYNVTFIYDQDNTEVIETEGTIKLPLPEKEGYVFLGWYNGEELFEQSVVSSDITLTGKWLALGTKYNVFYDTDGGELPEDWTRYYYFGTEATLPTPTKKYNEF